MARNSVRELFAAALRHHQAGHFAEAGRLYRKVLAADPAHADAHHQLGYLRHGEGRFAEARTHYLRAQALRPGNAWLYNNFGNLLKDEGDFAGARALYDRAIALMPDHEQAHYNRADLIRFHPGDPALAALERLADAPASGPHIHFALAKALDEVGDCCRSFAHLLRGNRLQRAAVSYDEAITRAWFAGVAAFDAAAPHAEVGSDLPVFIVGMPRSGTTLVEQILAGHPRIHTAGEWLYLEGVARAILGDRYPGGTADAAALARVGKAYLATLPSGPPGTRRILDKLPGNFLHVGLIRHILPRARIIHVRRDPVDTCFSCFSKLFGNGQAFSYDLAELGRYYRLYDRLMDHWRAVMPPGMMLDIAYEDVVADLEGTARRMVDFCGLEWDARCLDFHAGGRPVATASAVQVRRPVNRDGIGRWRRYADQLGPLLSALSGSG